jgi:hypothetical protein
MTVTFVRTKVSKEVRHTYEAAIASGEVPHSAQRVWRHVLGDAGMARRFGTGVPDGLIRDRPLRVPDLSN